VGRHVNISMVSKTSFPGFPYNTQYEKFEDFVALDQKHYYELLLYIANGGRDYVPFNVFIKDEPTKISKLVTFDARNITAPTAAERMLQVAIFSDFNNRVKDSAPFTEIQCEFNKWNGGFAKLYTRARRKLGGRFFYYDNRDYPKYDRSLPNEIRDVVFEFFKETAAPIGGFWMQAMEFCYSRQKESNLMDMAGHVWSKENGMASGDFCTSVWNSLVHFCLRLLEFREQYPEIAEDWEEFLQFYVAGDDYQGISIVPPPSDQFMAEFYGRFGMLTDPDKRNVSTELEGQKFLGCRLVFVGGAAQFTLEPKRALANLLYCTKDDDEMAQVIDALLAECWYDNKIRNMLLFLRGETYPQFYEWRTLWDIRMMHMFVESARSAGYPGQNRDGEKGRKEEGCVYRSEKPKTAEEGKLEKCEEEQSSYCRESGCPFC